MTCCGWSRSSTISGVSLIVSARAAAEQSVVAMARGVLMERLGLSSAEAASQLAGLAAATGVSLAEMAAAVLSPDVTAPT